MSLPSILVFSLATLPTASLGIAVLVYLSPYFASHLGVPLTVVGAAFAIVRAVDWGVDPLLGMIMDRTRTRFGRYRIWQFIGAPILMVATYKLFMAPYGIGEAYLITWVFLSYLGVSMLDLSRSAWTATLATQYDERSRVFGLTTAVQVLGNVAILTIPIFAARFGSSSGSATPQMGWFVILLTPVAVGLSAGLTREHVNAETRSAHPPWREYLAFARRPALVRLFLGQVAVSLGPNSMSAMYLFFFTASRGYTAAQASTLLLVFLMSGVIGAPLTARVARRIGKHRTLMLTTTLFSLSLCTALAFPRGNVPAVLPMMSLCGMMSSGFGLMISAMAADFGDEVRLDQGKEQLSLIYAMLSFANKLAQAASIILTYSVLSAVGFKAAEGAVNTPAAIHGLEATFLIGPILFVMLGGACFIGWKLDARRHGEIRMALDARDRAIEASRVGGQGDAGPVVALAEGRG